MTLTVVAETDAKGLTPATLECVAEVQELAQTLDSQVQVFLVGHQLTELTQTLAAHGVRAITVLDHEALARFSGDGWLACLEQPLRNTGSRLILTPDSSHARAWLPRLALRWRVPLISGCGQIRVDTEGRFSLTRPKYSGLQQEQLTAPAVSPLLVTLRPGARGVEPALNHDQAQTDITTLTPELEPTTWRDQTLERLPSNTQAVDISEAERIVAGGLGLGSPEAVDTLWQLARPLQATIAGTRVISDRGWIPHERYIGSTGKRVAPKLYIALGISGASQHTVGMSNSETIIAINSDRTAPIFGLADLGIVGDLHEIVPLLLARLDEDS